MKNPELVRELPGRDVIEGVFKEKYVAKRNKEGFNVYWFPNHPKKNVYSDEKKYVNGRDIDIFEFLFVDMDLKDGIYKTKEAFYEEVSKFPLKPTLTVDSGNGVHVYWKMKDLNRDAYVVMQKRLIQHFKTDDSIWTVLQIMRYPGSLNTKKADEFKQTAVHESLSTGKEYKLSQFHKVLPEISEKNAEKAQNHLDKLDGKITLKLSEDVNIDELPDKFIELMEKDKRIRDIFEDPVGSYGDRSKADAALANMLLSKNFNRKEASIIISNGQKALSKGPNRMSYAIATVDFVYNDRIKNQFQTVGEKSKAKKKVNRGEPVNGPEIFDCLKNKWRKSQVLGMIAGSGVGKTTVALKCVKDMIKNNPDNDDIFIFFSLEMPEYEIEERWVRLVGKNSELADRLYVIGNEDDAGEPRNISLQDIYTYAKDIELSTGKNIGSIVIDHVGLVNPVINLKRKPTFGAEGDIDGGHGINRVLTLPSLCKAMKPLAKQLNTFLILLTQTTKSKGAGDTPLDKDAAFGTASYEWNMDYILTMWQPLMRIYKETDIRVLAWQYAKIRNKHREDPISTHEPILLNYDMDSGDLNRLSGEDYATFEQLLPVANEARRAADKKESSSYSRGPSLKDLKKLRLT